MLKSVSMERSRVQTSQICNKKRMGKTRQLDLSDALDAWAT